MTSLNLDKSAIDDKEQSLKSVLEKLPSVLVAFSGGADSTLLLAMCQKYVPGKVIAATASSVLHYEQKTAKGIAYDFGVSLLSVSVPILENQAFVGNPPNRCYECKKMIFSKLLEVAGENGVSVVVEGSNTDDLNEYRPGRKAIAELGVKSPLQAAGFSKENVRELLRLYQLPSASRPSDTCMATRFPYNTQLTKALLEKVHKAEQAVRTHVPTGPLRVRHIDNCASIEVAPENISILKNETVFNGLVTVFESLGFESVAINKGGYQSGNMDKRYFESSQNAH